jgi:annexin A7/11
MRNLTRSESGRRPRSAPHRAIAHAQGFGTDESVIIDTLAPLDAFQMDQLSRTYEQLVGRTLVKTLEKELSSW